MVDFYSTLISASEIRLLIFDLDGTLIDSEQDLTIAVNATRVRALEEWLIRRAEAGD